MYELAGFSNKLVLVGIGRMFADGVELCLFFGKAKIEDGPAVSRPAGRPDRPGGDLELAVLLAVEIDQPQGARFLPVEHLRAARPAYRVAEHPRDLGDGGGRAF